MRYVTETKPPYAKKEAAVPCPMKKILLSLISYYQYGNIYAPNKKAFVSNVSNGSQDVFA